MISDGPGCKEILSSHIIRTNMRRQSVLKEAIPNSRPKLPKYLHFLWTEK
jgi:hypothetical protein